MSVEQKEFKLKSEDFSKEKLELSWIAEKIKLQSDLSSLHENILKGDDEKTIDLSKVKSYLETLKDKSRIEINNEGGAWSFAVQLFLKSQGLYEGKVDGLYLTKGKESESKTRSAVRKFQEKWNIDHPENKLEKIDGRAGKETIKKMLEVMKLSNPERNMLKIQLNIDILAMYDKLNPIEKQQFRTGMYSIETDKYSYKIKNGELHKIHKPVDDKSIEEVLLEDGKRSEVMSKIVTTIIDNGKPVENKTPVVNKEEAKLDKLFDGVAYTWKEIDFEKYLEKEYGKMNYMNFYVSSNWDNLEKTLLSKNKEKISKDTKLCTYMLYKAMKGAGTNKKLVSRIFENYEGSLNSLSILFGKPSGKNVFDYVDSEYFNKKDLINLLNKQLEKAKSKPSKEDIDLIESNIKKIKEKYMMESPNVDNNTINNNSHSNNISNENIYLSNNRKLSEEQYLSLFSGLETIGQGALGDCYLISAINVLARCPYFDTLMKTSIQIGKDKNGNAFYRLTMPLGEPNGIKVDIDTTELKLAKIRGNIGYKVLEVGFAKYIMKQTKLGTLDYNELSKISGGLSGFALQTFLGGKSLSGYTILANNKSKLNYNPQEYSIKGIGLLPTLSDMDNADKKAIVNLLKTYDLGKGQGFLTVSTINGESHDKVYTVGQHTLYKRHSYAILGTEKNVDGSIKYIKVLNPWNINQKVGGSIINMSLDDFMSSFASMDVGMLTNTFLNGTTANNEITITDTKNRKG